MKKEPVKTVLSPKDLARLDEFTQGEASTFAQALDLWENERQALAELYAQNQEQSALLSDFKELVTQSRRVIRQLVREADLFFTQKSRDATDTLWNKTEILEKILKNKVR